MNPLIQDRLARAILRGGSFTADDITSAGVFAVDVTHGANGAQSAIGSVFRWAASRNLIEPTGEVVRSSAPQRKGGAIRVWVGTPKGRTWADARTGQRGMT